MDSNWVEFKPTKKLHRKLFSIEEDAHLRYLVSQYGNKDFKKIAALMPGRTARQVRERYKNYLSPEINNGPWNREEDRLLRLKYLELGPKWSKIAEFFPTRSDINIKNRWTSIGEKKASQTFSIPDAKLSSNSFNTSDSAINIPIAQQNLYIPQNLPLYFPSNAKSLSSSTVNYEKNRTHDTSHNKNQTTIEPDKLFETSNKNEVFCNTEEFDRDDSDLFSFTNSIAEEQNLLSIENAFQSWNSF